MVNEELGRQEDLLNQVNETKRITENMAEYQKSLDDIQVAFNSQNMAGISDILKHISIQGLTNHKHIPFVEAIFFKFAQTLQAIQDSVFRSFDIRDPVEVLDGKVDVLQQIYKTNLIAVAKDSRTPQSKFWSICTSQANSIIEIGEITKSEFCFSKEDDLIYRLKADVYEKFIAAQSFLNMEDLSKNCPAYLESIGKAISGLHTCSRVFDTTDEAKRQFAEATKELVAVLTERIDSIAEFLDYRLVEHASLSSAVSKLVSVFTRLYFFNNPDDENKQLKETLFKLLVEFYKHQLRVITAGSMPC